MEERHNKWHDKIPTTSVIVFFYNFHSILFYFHRNILKLKLILSNLYTWGTIRLKSLCLYLTKLMVLSFVIIGSLLAINFIAFWGVSPCNLVDYMSFVGEYKVTWAAYNSEIYFNLCASPLYKLSHSNSPEFTYKYRTVKKYKHER
jgi:hypothetical protein